MNCARTAEDPPIKEENKKIQGDWILLQKNGVDEKKGVSLIWTIKAATIKPSTKGADLIPYQIDPSKNPKWIDLGDKAFFVEPGIYKLEGDKLTIRLTTEGKDVIPFDRPKDFDHKTGPRGSLLVFERIQK